MGKTVRFVIYLLTAGLLALLAAVVIVPRLMGWVPLTVLSGSMEPTVSVGSQIIVKPVDDTSQISTGDIVTFMPRPNDDTLVTHRVVGVSVDGSGKESFITKGDANNAADPETITRTQLRGKLLYQIPLVGRLSLAVTGQTRLILITATGLGLLGYAAWQTVSLIRDGKQQGRGVRERESVNHG